MRTYHIFTAQCVAREYPYQLQECSSDLNNTSSTLVEFLHCLCVSDAVVKRKFGSGPTVHSTLGPLWVVVGLKHCKKSYPLDYIILIYFYIIITVYCIYANKDIYHHYRLYFH